MGNKVEQFQVLDTFKGIIESTWESSKAAEFCECLLFINDFEAWVNCLEAMPQSVLFQSALNECAVANMFCSMGLYKQAMISLRLSLEHSLHAILLSTNDFRFRLWKEGQADMTWKSIVDDQNGIFSKAFIHAYAPEFEERSGELLTIAKTIYRECSEYVHGNFDKLNILPKQSEFDQNLFERYINAFQSVSYLLSVILVIRFKDYLISNHLLQQMEESIMHNISVLPEIQALYEKGGSDIQ